MIKLTGTHYYVLSFIVDIIDMYRPESYCERLPMSPIPRLLSLSFLRAKEGRFNFLMLEAIQFWFGIIVN